MYICMITYMYNHVLYMYTYSISIYIYIHRKPILTYSHIQKEPRFSKLSERLCFWSFHGSCSGTSRGNLHHCHGERQPVLIPTMAIASNVHWGLAGLTKAVKSCRIFRWKLSQRLFARSSKQSQRWWYVIFYWAYRRFSSPMMELLPNQTLKPAP